MKAPPVIPIQSQAGSTEKEKMTGYMLIKDIHWMEELFRKIYGENWRENSRQELGEGFLQVSDDDQNSCTKQPAQKGSYVRPYIHIGLNRPLLVHGTATHRSTVGSMIRFGDDYQLVQLSSECSGTTVQRIRSEIFWRSRRVCCLK